MHSVFFILFIAQLWGFFISWTLYYTFFCILLVGASIFILCRCWEFKASCPTQGTVSGMESVITFLDSIQKLHIPRKTQRNKLLRHSNNLQAHLHPPQCPELCDEQDTCTLLTDYLKSLYTNPHFSAFKVIPWCGWQKSTLSLSFLLSSIFNSSAPAGYKGTVNLGNQKVTPSWSPSLSEDRQG